MGPCLQSLEKPSEHTAWEPGRKSQGTSQLPMVLLRPTDSPQTHTRPPLSAQTSTEDADTVHLTVIHPNWHRAEHLRDPASPLPARPQV